MSIRRSLAATAAGALLITLAPGPFAAAAEPDRAGYPGASGLELTSGPATGESVSREKGPVLSLGDGPGRELYIVRLEAPAVPTRALASRSDGIQATTERGYRAALVDQQADLRSSIARITGAAARVRHSYTDAINGIAVELTREQASRVARIDGVAGVQVDFTRRLTTDVGPEWIGAPGLWEGTATPAGVSGSRGEGVVVGVLDTGINPANPSFADTVPVEDGGDGYDHTNPHGAGNYVGVCDPADPSFVADWGCNDKLIGYWNFQGANPYDDDGHGSHTASTAAGNQVDATTYSAKGDPDNESSWTGTIKGVAPHANIIGYDVCDGDGCQGTAILAGIDQAIADGVDAINYSIGSSSPGSPWTDLDALGFLNARAAGIHVATSAGNDGPGVATLGSPGDSPWMTTVGATQHNRQWQAQVQNLTSDGAPLTTIDGVGFSAATDGSSPLVYAGDLSAAAGTCGATALAGIDLTGRIVVCDRGGVEAGEPIGRVQKGVNALARGAEGMILANDEASGTSINADAHVLPAVHITHADGVALKAWMASVSGESASLSGGLRHVGADVADIMASFSSRGPNRAISMISPSVSAPGVDILAAAGTDNATEWQFISGTSMASPHTAGALALLDAIRPDWSPAEAQSALMTTAVTDIADDDGTAADWFGMGSGRVDLTKAARAGVLLDESEADYLAADPAEGGDVRAVNTASLADNECLQDCSWTRTLTGTATGVGEWTVAVESGSADLTLETGATTLDVTDGGTVTLDVTAHVAPGADTDTWLFGVVTLTPPAGSEAPVAHLPVAVLPSSGVLPDSIDVTTRRDAGSQPVEGLEAIDVSELQVSASGLVPGQRDGLSIVEDDTNTDPFDGNGTHVTEVEVPADASRLIAKLENATAPDFDLFVGTGELTEDNVVCMSATGGSAEACEVAEPAPGTWWIVVQNWEATTAGGTDTVDLVTALVAGDQDNLSAEGPAGPIPAGTPFDVRAFWDEPEMDAGETWYGALTLGTGPASPDDIGVIPVTIQRVEDDVTKTADRATAAPGDTVTYTVDVAPNVTQEDLAYQIDDTLTPGTTYVEGSATGGATYSNGVVSWEGVLPTTYGVQGDYEVTTSVDDPECVNPFTGTAEYLDLRSVSDSLTTLPQYTGDSRAFRLFPNDTFGWYGEQHSGLWFTDDGYLTYDVDGWLAAADWYTPQVLPDADDPNDVAAMLWQDMELHYDAAANHGVTWASVTGGSPIRIIEFDDVRPYQAPAGVSYDFEVFAFAGSSDLVVIYDNITGPLNEVTIGAEDADGTAATALVNKGDASSVIDNDTVVCMDYEEPVAQSSSFSYQVKVDEGVAGGTELVNEAEHVTDDPGAKPAVARDTVTVTKRASTMSLALDPTSIVAGGTTTAMATVTSPAATKPTGQVQFRSGDTVLGMGTLDATGRVTATLSGFADAGTFPVTARYVGDAMTEGSTSAPVNLVVSATQPPPKATPAIKIKTKKKIEIGTRPRVKVVVSAAGVTPTGTVKVTVRSGTRTKTYQTVLNADGKATLKLKKAKRLGKLKVKVVYSGDAAVEPGRAKTTIRVVPRR